MKLLLISIAGLIASFTNSFYSLSVQNTEGATINLNDFQGKRILIVNIATESPKVNQLQALQALQQQYGDSLVVIGFPSNSFGNEPRNNESIKQFCISNYGTSFSIAAKGNVKGAGLQSVYNWLTHSNENGVINGEVKEDFQKFVINKNGELVGVFAGSTPPNHPGIIQAITQN